MVQPYSGSDRCNENNANHDWLIPFLVFNLASDDGVSKPTSCPEWLFWARMLDWLPTSQLRCSPWLLRMNWNRMREEQRMMDGPWLCGNHTCTLTISSTQRAVVIQALPRPCYVLAYSSLQVKSNVCLHHHMMACTTCFKAYDELRSVTFTQNWNHCF